MDAILISYALRCVSELLNMHALPFPAVILNVLRRYKHI